MNDYKRITPTDTTVLDKEEEPPKPRFKVDDTVWEASWDFCCGELKPRAIPRQVARVYEFGGEFRYYLFGRAYPMHEEDLYASKEELLAKVQKPKWRDEK